MSPLAFYAALGLLVVSFVGLTIALCKVAANLDRDIEQAMSEGEREACEPRRPTPRRDGMERVPSPPRFRLKAVDIPRDHGTALRFRLKTRAGR